MLLISHPAEAHLVVRDDFGSILEGHLDLKYIFLSLILISVFFYFKNFILEDNFREGKNVLHRINSLFLFSFLAFLDHNFDAEVTPEYALRIHLWQCLGDHIGAGNETQVG